VATDRTESVNSFVPLGATNLDYGRGTYQSSVYYSIYATGCGVNGDLSGVVQISCRGVCSPRIATASVRSRLVVNLGAIPTVVNVVVFTLSNSAWRTEQFTNSGGILVGFGPPVWGTSLNSDAGYIDDEHVATLESADCRSSQGDCVTNENDTMCDTALKYAQSGQHHINCGGAIRRYLFICLKPTTYWSVREVAACANEAMSRAPSASHAPDPSNQSMIPPSVSSTWHPSPAFTTIFFGYPSVVQVLTFAVNDLLNLSAAPFAPVFGY